MDRKFRLARVWSNNELKKVSSLFSGDIINVSGWKDEDKEGGYYKDYFSNSRSYSISNYKNEAKGFQGVDGEIFLDLEKQLDPDLERGFDVVFNHTTLEHVFDVQKAVKNLCLLSRDIVIAVVPFLQEMHGLYGDFWRFTPSAIQRMFASNGFEVFHLTFNKEENSSVYIFFIASKNPDKWKSKYEWVINSGLDQINKQSGVIGYNAILNPPKSKKRKFRFW